MRRKDSRRRHTWAGLEGIKVQAGKSDIGRCWEIGLSEDWKKPESALNLGPGSHPAPRGFSLNRHYLSLILKEGKTWLNA